MSNSPRACAAHIVIDDYLPQASAAAIAEAFPSERSAFDRLSTFRERKWTSNALDALPPILREALLSFQSPQVIAEASRATGIADLIPDPTCYAGGVSAMQPKDFLNPHIDNSHNGGRTHYRRLNLLYYCNPSWRVGDGGELELWDRNVCRAVAIAPKFNRLILMTTNRTSWHSVAPVRRGERRCLSNYLFSQSSPDGSDYYHVTSYTGRPGQTGRRALAIFDNAARQFARRLGARRGSDRGYHAAIHH